MAVEDRVVNVLVEVFYARDIALLDFLACNRHSLRGTEKTVHVWVQKEKGKIWCRPVAAAYEGNPKVWLGRKVNLPRLLSVQGFDGLVRREGTGRDRGFDKEQKRGKVSRKRKVKQICSSAARACEEPSTTSPPGVLYEGFAETDGVHFPTKGCVFGIKIHEFFVFL